MSESSSTDILSRGTDGSAAGNVATDGGIKSLDRTGSDERTSNVGNEYETFAPHDNGGRRSWIERRQFSYLCHIPERRSGIDRRKLEDRRFGFDTKSSDLFIDRRGRLPSSEFHDI